ncbi:cysteine hydrolase family protein [Devriesea agamarum]|uniref:cysteine hydrolase family protein n=1 Tax=Devriesea agamarum TaxID=472569 RepID=UPI00071E325E|nr:isochorismatase family protein [Devriesea agamarum]
MAPWLVAIDLQRIFAAPSSPWASPDFDRAFSVIQELAPRFGPRVLLTRWLPTADRSTSWGEYFAQWPFADRNPDDPLFDLIDDARVLSAHPTLDLPTFGKWGPELVGAIAQAERRIGGQAVDTAEGTAESAEWTVGPVDSRTAPSWSLDRAPSLILTGVATDCCVIATALAAGDAGARVQVVADACAGSTPDNHAAAMQVMGLFPPQVSIVDSTAVQG